MTQEEKKIMWQSYREVQFEEKVEELMECEEGEEPIPLLFAQEMARQLLRDERKAHFQRQFAVYGNSLGRYNSFYKPRR